MSTFTGLNTMVRGVYINQLALNTVGHNIVNADTDGYSRQHVTPVATTPEYLNGYAVGTGAAAMSVTRARDVYADIQFRSENSKKGYYEASSINFDKLESVFNDSTDSGIQNAMEEFYQAWLNLSVNASDSSSRTAIVQKGKTMSDIIFAVNEQLRDQVADKYSDLEAHVEDINEIVGEIAKINGIIIARESDGKTAANDLRDQRDELVDRLSNYININVHESGNSYQLSTNGVTLISGSDRLHFEFSKGVSSADYGVDYNVVDYDIKVKETDIAFRPATGLLRSEMDAVDECKAYMDKIVAMAAYMLTALNDQHKQGYDLTGELARNFYGETGETYEYHYDKADDRLFLRVINDTDGEYKLDKDGNVIELTGIEILRKLVVNSDFNLTGGYKYIGAATAYDDGQDYTSTTDMTESGGRMVSWNNRSGDGTNAVYVSELFNMNYDSIVSAGRANVPVITRFAATQSTLNPIGGLSLNAYYKTAMTKLGVDAAAMDMSIEQQDLIMEQIQNWRDSTSGVDWNEELADMIKFQKGFGSCSRCLSAMDECLDRLVNNTGTVGR